MIQHATTKNFDDVVLASGIPVLVDFYADWCGPCKMMSPILEAVSEELDGQLLICKVNVDESMELAQKYRIMNIPAMFLFKNGEVAEKLIGAMSKAALVDAIKKHLA